MNNKHVIIIFGVFVLFALALGLFYFQSSSNKLDQSKALTSPNKDTIFLSFSKALYGSKSSFLQYSAFVDTCANSTCFVSLTNSLPEDVGIGFIIEAFNIPDKIAEYDIEILSSQTLDDIVTTIDRARQEKHYTLNPTYGGTIQFISKENITLNGTPAIEQEIITKKFRDGKEIYHKLYYLIRNNAFYKIRYSYPLELSSQAKPFIPEIENTVANIKFFNNEAELRAAQQQLVTKSSRVYKSKIGYSFQYPSGYRLERLTSGGIFHTFGYGEASIFARRLGVQLVNEANNSVELSIYDNQEDLLGRRGAQSPKEYLKSLEDFKKTKGVIKNEEIQLPSGIKALRQLYHTYGYGRDWSDYLGERVVVQSGNNFIIFRPMILNAVARQGIEQEGIRSGFLINEEFTDGVKNKIIAMQNIFDETLFWKVVKGLSFN